MPKNMPLPQPRPAMTRLYNEDFPKGKTFPKSEEANLVLRGWRTCPTQVGQPMVPVGINSRSSSEDLIKAVQEMGFNVTPDELVNPNEKADSEPEQAKELGLDVEPSLTNEGTDHHGNLEMIELFNESPAQLSEAELLELGKGLGVDVRANMKTATIVERIKSHLDGDKAAE